MNTFTKTLIASAMAVAVAGPVNADIDWNDSDLKMVGSYTGSKTKLQITPSGCKNWNKKNVTSAIAFGEIDDPDFAIPELPGFRGMAFAGCWEMETLTFLPGENEIFTGGSYIERKVSKDLTMALTGETVSDIVDIMEIYLKSADASKCNAIVLDPVIHTETIVKKGQGKLSKNGERIKVDIQVDTKYKNTKGKDKNIKAKISGKMDHQLVVGNPINDCAAVWLID